jgi:hypothetical protein
MSESLFGMPIIECAKIPKDEVWLAANVGVHIGDDFQLALLVGNAIKLKGLSDAKD